MNIYILFTKYPTSIDMPKYISRQPQILKFKRGYMTLSLWNWCFEHNGLFPDDAHGVNPYPHEKRGGLWMDSCCSEAYSLAEVLGEVWLGGDLFYPEIKEYFFFKNGNSKKFFTLLVLAQSQIRASVWVFFLMAALQSNTFSMISTSIEHW